MCVGLDVPNNMSVIMWRRYYASHFLFLWICLRLNANVSEMDAYYYIDVDVKLLETVSSYETK